MISGRNLLAALSIKYNGDFKLMLKAIKEKEKLTDEEVDGYLKSIKSKYLTILDDEYPDSLKRVFMPPLVLYYYGDISLLNKDNNLIAVIGSRHSTEYGEKTTKIFSESLAKNKRIIVSGLAMGIDSIAHQTCIDNAGKTIAILGSGIDYPYPKSNKKLYDIIKKDHLLISEYPNKYEPTKECFPMRNRIVAALANKVLVTEAYANSGTCITVMYALSMGKDVLAVPAEIFKMSATNKIIQDGGFLVDNVEDLLFLTKKQEY